MITMQGDLEEFFESSETKVLFILGMQMIRKKESDLTKEMMLELYSKHFKILDTSMENLLDSMVKESILSKSDNKYSLTDAGKQKITAEATYFYDFLYSKGFVALDASELFRKITTKLHGRYLGQLDMTDSEQIDKLLTLLKASEPDSILDLGCGLGYVTELMQKQTGAFCTGIDIASAALELCRKRYKENQKLKYVHGDITNPDFPPSSFDAIVSIDTLYFVQDLPKTVENLKRLLKPGGDMFAFFTQRRYGEEPDSAFTPDGTKLAQILQEMDLKYDYYEFSENELRYWKSKKQLLMENKEKFLREVGEDVFGPILDETEETAKYDEDKPVKRYLYHVKAD